MNTQREVLFALLLAEVLTEIRRSEDKFGNQDKNPMNPFNTPRHHPLGVPIQSPNYLWNIPRPQVIQTRNDEIMKTAPGTIDHLHIILEEFTEVIDEIDPTLVRKELIQLACVTVKAIRALDAQHSRP